MCHLWLWRWFNQSMMVLHLITQRYSNGCKISLRIQYHLCVRKAEKEKVTWLMSLPTLQFLFWHRASDKIAMCEPQRSDTSQQSRDTSSNKYTHPPRQILCIQRKNTRKITAFKILSYSTQNIEEPSECEGSSSPHVKFHTMSDADSVRDGVKDTNTASLTTQSYIHRINRKVLVLT